MYNITELRDNELHWLIKGMYVAYDAGNYIDTAYQVSTKFVRQAESVNVIFEYTYGEKNNGKADPTENHTEYFETNETFTINSENTLLKLNDKVMEALNNITQNRYDYGE